MSAAPATVETLNSFSYDERQHALASLVERGSAPADEVPWVNLHMHTFFSYNGEGWSPSRAAWEAKRIGLYAAGIVDFDVLDGLGEFYAASDYIGLRGIVGFESRTFFKEYAGHEINSPGEPGVFYFMGVGFRDKPEEGTRPAEVFSRMLEQSHRRNRDLIERVNGALGTIRIDYENDVLPLTPARNATERHIVRAYFDKALALAGGDLDKAAGNWAKSLGADAAALRKQIRDTNAFVDMLRSKMMKKGGLGYVQPTEATFPALDDVVAMILECGAVPTSAWLDGTSSGEADPAAQLECLVAKGVAAANIIPDRNWNVGDPVKAARLGSELHRYAKTCAAMDLPVLVGTELNKPGQRLVDDFSAGALKPLHGQFIKGAEVMVGHTRFFRYADFSYVGAAAASEYPDRAGRNRVFAAVGALPPPSAEARMKMDTMSAEKALAYLHDCARKNEWRR